ncbi:MAG: ethanolamine ammonia-lyase subunit EutB [Planctomycetota bacterium]
MNRRQFLVSTTRGAVATAMLTPGGHALRVTSPRSEEDLVGYVLRVRGEWDQELFAQLLGSANAFKEGDEILGLAAESDAARASARALLARTRLSDIDAHPLLDDPMHRTLSGSVDADVRRKTEGWTFDALRRFLLDADEDAIQAVMPGLSSDVIGCVVKILSDDELIAVSQRIWNPLPGTRIGAKGYLGARVQPNSPTDHPDDIRWQVFDAFAYAVGDVLLGTNPVSSEVDKVAEVESVLRDVLETFGLADTLPHCVLAHIDIQAEVEKRQPGSTALWFQSIAGSDAANQTFDVTVEGLLRHADARKGRYGLYFETGQGADFTNGHGQGMDMVLHESRKYGLARLLSQRVAVARGDRAWVHVNDVAGFIGPEVFRTRDQLVRCCLEDLVMGKLHGLCIGLDVCSTLHMDVSLDDLEHCLDAVAPANPAYLMALPTPIDPMLGYLTTSYQDHVRLREKHGLRIDERMSAFFADLGVIDESGRPAEHFGDPLHVYRAYRRKKGDARPDEAILAEGRQKMAEVRGRGVFLAEGHGETPAAMEPRLQAQVQSIYADAKKSLWAEFTKTFLASMPNALVVQTRSTDRNEYILRPSTGEELDAPSAARIEELRAAQDGTCDVQIVVSDGLNALALMEEDQLGPHLDALRKELLARGLRVSDTPIVVESGRVRAGYRIGEQLFAGLPGPRTVLHVIGERPGTGHRTFSVYITSAEGEVWGASGRVDHDITRVVAGIARTAQDPVEAASTVVRVMTAELRSVGR